MIFFGRDMMTDAELKLQLENEHKILRGFEDAVNRCTCGNKQPSGEILRNMAGTVTPFRVGSLNRAAYAKMMGRIVDYLVLNNVPVPDISGYK